MATPFFVVLATIICWIPLMEMGQLRFGEQKGHTAAIHDDSIRAEAISLYNLDYDYFMNRAQEALDAPDVDAVAYHDLDLEPQTPYDVVQRYGLTKDEIFAIMQYSGNTNAGTMIRRFWQYTHPEPAIPTLARLLYDATHKDARVNDFFNTDGEGIRLYFGFQNIDIPIKVNGEERYAGDTLTGETLWGVWSSSTSWAVAANSHFAPCSADDGEQWLHEAKWMKNDATVIFEIYIPPHHTAVAARAFGALPVEELSSHGWEKEILLYDIPGKYVEIAYVCYNEKEDDPEKRMKEAFTKQSVRVQAMRREIFNCIEADICSAFRRGGYNCKCPTKVEYHYDLPERRRIEIVCSYHGRRCSCSRATGESHPHPWNWDDLWRELPRKDILTMKEYTLFYSSDTEGLDANQCFERRAEARDQIKLTLTRQTIQEQLEMHEAHQIEDNYLDMNT